jgi:AraC-like DNA-binding protein
MSKAKRFPGWGSAQVAVLLEFAQSEGLSIAHCLQNSGLNESTLHYTDPTLVQELAVIQQILQTVNGHPFQLGVDVGRTCNAHTFGLMGQALLACRTPKDIGSLVTRYFSKDHHFLKIHQNISGRKIHTTFDIPKDLPTAEAQFILGRDMGAAVAFQKSALAGFKSPVPVIEVGFMGEQLPGMSDIGECYGCEVLYNQPQNYLINEIDIRNMLLPLGNKLLSTVLAKRIQNALQRDTTDAVAHEGMKAKISAQLESTGYIDMSRDEMARQLNVSPRTLSRYLQSEGTSWRRLFAQIRMDKAKVLLTSSSDSIEVTATQLGFASASAFSTAFSRETGVSPWEFRRSQHSVFSEY